MKTQTQAQERTGKEQTEEKESYGLNHNSLIPAIEESQRFIHFLNNRFELNLPSNYITTINKTGRNTIGFFMPKEHQEHFQNTKQALNNINLNTYYLKTNNPYEVLAHEIAHFINHNKKIKDCSSNNYHNKHFKQQAELLLLSVKRNNKGYAETNETKEFKEMVEQEFKPNKEVFNIFQNKKEKGKVGSRLKLYVCSCGFRVRVAREDFKALCLYCETEFKQNTSRAEPRTQEKMKSENKRLRIKQSNDFKIKSNVIGRGKLNEIQSKKEK